MNRREFIASCTAFAAAGHLIPQESCPCSAMTWPATLEIVSRVGDQWVTVNNRQVEIVCDGDGWIDASGPYRILNVEVPD